MFARFFVPLACLAACITAQNGAAAFESEKFNVTKALEELGVDVKVLPKTEGSTIAGRSALKPCALAVSTIDVLLMMLMLTTISVCFPNHTVR
jgi:hypothetical protein